MKTYIIAQLKDSKILLSVVFIALLLLFIHILFLSDIKDKTILRNNLQNTTYQAVGVDSHHSPKTNLYQDYGIQGFYVEKIDDYELAQRINTRVFSKDTDTPTDFVSPFDFHPKMLYDISISEKIAQQYNLNIGDHLYRSEAGEIQTYTIQYIHPTYYNLYQLNMQDLNPSLLIHEQQNIGLNHVTIHFFDDSDYTYSEIHLKHEDISIVESSLYLDYVYLGFLQGMLLLIVMIFMYKPIYQKCLYFVKHGKKHIFMLLSFEACKKLLISSILTAFILMLFNAVITQIMFLILMSLVGYLCFILLFLWHFKRGVAL